MTPLFGKKAAKPINYFTDIMARFVKLVRLRQQNILQALLHVIMAVIR